MKKALIVLILTAVVLSGCVKQGGDPQSKLPELKKFSSIDEARDFIKKNAGTSTGFYGVYEATGLQKTAADSESSTSKAAPDFSATNIQAQGVDEADIVKTDGKYIYTVSGNSLLSIVEAYPPENAKVLSEINLNGSIHEIFVNGDKLVVFGTEIMESDIATDKTASDFYYKPIYRQSKEVVKVYDISDRKSPLEERKLELEGDYFDSRMIGSWVYFVVNKGVYDDIILPLETKEIFYFDTPAPYYSITLIGALNLNSQEEVSTKTFLIPYTENMFVSLDNIYITHQKFQTPEEDFSDMVKEVLMPVLPESLSSKINEIHNKNLSLFEKNGEINMVLTDFDKQLTEEEREGFRKRVEESLAELQKKQEMTVVYKISIKGGDIELSAKGDFPGKVLNQFSMDEFKGHFRAAATTGDVWAKTSKNHVYVLDAGLNVVGKVEDLAPGERIYSARFLGERAYVVTFKKVDPLFVIDLKDPKNPKVLGKLKIPGYSDYLHPYDQNYVIGIGKNTIEASEELKGQRNLDFAWYQGVKLALFDATDPENPKEVSKFIIGDRGTESLALQDHKAFLFSKERNLLVIPVLLAEIKDKTDQTGSFGPQYGEYTFQGAYVFELTLDKGFELKGRVTHVKDSEAFKKSGYYYFGAGDAIHRSLYIGNVLYTISDRFIKANSLEGLSDLKTLEMAYKQPDYPDYIIE